MKDNFNEFKGMGMTSERSRDNLIETLKQKGIKNNEVLKIMKKIPRHIFVDEAISNQAYDNTALPIGSNQTISQPLIVAKMTELLISKNPKRILEIGTGSGYQAVVLSQFAQKVFTIERIKTLHDEAKRIFKILNIHNIYSKHSDGNNGWPEKACFDAIIYTAAANTISTSISLQLCDNGILLAPVCVGSKQILREYLKKDNKLIYVDHGEVNFVPLLSGKK
ncbi:MAG: protein-L-isoaspartate(D-aspartate) O-methyltransferase [Pseudomonadota bacterium]|nr:protein-L-isoaspartate(D-aspartate) O-methyltransferase [Pseudomonadota bacterium]